MKRLHKEVDHLRKSGALKEALDLARYAHSQTPNHTLLKRSYAWAVYSQIKSKVSLLLDDIRSNAITPREIATAAQPRVIELNQLCREYRVNKLPKADLCFSLILRALCKLSPPPLGLYGLLKWSRSKGLRREDYEVYTPPEMNAPPMDAQPPLIILLAQGLETLCCVFDQDIALYTKVKSLKEDELAALAARIYSHADRYYQESSTHLRGEGEQSLLWRALWLSRRAGDFNRGVHCALQLIEGGGAPASTWWELARCISEEKRLTVHKMSLNADHPKSEDLKSAYFLALNSINEAKICGLEDPYLSIVYAQIAYWAYVLGLYKEAQASLTWAIKTAQTHSSVVPYAWIRDLASLGGELNETAPIFEQMLNEMNRYLPAWLNAQREHDDLMPSSLSESSQ